MEDNLYLYLSRIIRIILIVILILLLISLLISGSYFIGTFANSGPKGSTITSGSADPTSQTVPDNTSPQKNDYHINTSDPDEMVLYQYNGNSWVIIGVIPAGTTIDQVFMESLLQSSYHFKYITSTGFSNRSFFINAVSSNDHQYSSVATNSGESNTHIPYMADNNLQLAAVVIAIKGASTGIGSDNSTDPMILNLRLHKWRGSEPKTEQPISITIPRAPEPTGGIYGTVTASENVDSYDTDIRYFHVIPESTIITVDMGYLFGLEFKTPDTRDPGVLANIDNSNIKLIFKRKSSSTIPHISM